MSRSLLLAVVAAAFALPAVAEETPSKTPSASAETGAAKSAAPDKTIVMRRTLAMKSCSPFLRHRRVVWGRLPQTQEH